MNEISENTSNDELNKLFMTKIQFGENYTRLSATRRSRVQNEEIQNMHYMSHKESLNLQDNNLLMAKHWANKLNVKEYICAANWR